MMFERIFPVFFYNILYWGGGSGESRAIKNLYGKKSLLPGGLLSSLLLTQRFGGNVHRVLLRFLKVCFCKKKRPSIFFLQKTLCFRQLPQLNVLRGSYWFYVLYNNVNSEWSGIVRRPVWVQEVCIDACPMRFLFVFVSFLLFSFSFFLLFFAICATKAGIKNLLKGKPKWGSVKPEPHSARKCALYFLIFF